MTGEHTKAETDARFNSQHSAFPCALSPGLTKREYFAACALKGLAQLDLDPDAAAAESVLYADALLLALARDEADIDVA